ncbi:Nanog variant A [Moorella thermoacetica Y72]|uniref:Nanog variant A n=1 Tax=Moorella thermoacetica Y72 TaxID=1325331 RepID=A0A0S6UBQ4_NEOTH|nr:Nanog variant A [Moorella thermoacetica Y72]
MISPRARSPNFLPLLSQDNQGCLAHISGDLEEQARQHTKE